VLSRLYGVAYFFPGTPDGTPKRAAIDAVAPKLEPHFDLLDRAVAKTGYLVGNALTLADINLIPLMYYMVPEGGSPPDLRMPPETLSRSSSVKRPVSFAESSFLCTSILRSDFFCFVVRITVHSMIIKTRACSQSLRAGYWSAS